MGKSGNTTEKLELAARIRQIRENAGLTQEKFAELLGITLSAYKKIESAENQISLDGLRKLEKELKVSSDYILFGKNEDVDDVWKMIQNCSENDKMFLLFKLIIYFTKVKERSYCLKEKQADYDCDILNILKEM